MRVFFRRKYCKSIIETLFQRKHVDDVCDRKPKERWFKKKRRQKQKIPAEVVSLMFSHTADGLTLFQHIT